MGPQLYVATRVLTRGGVVETHRGKATRRRGRGPEQRDASDSRGPRHWARQARARPRAREGCGPPAPGLRPCPPRPSGRLASGHLRLRQLQAASTTAWRGFVSRGSRIQTGAWSSHLTGNYVKRSSEFFFLLCKWEQRCQRHGQGHPLAASDRDGDRSAHEASARASPAQRVVCAASRTTVPPCPHPHFPRWPPSQVTGQPGF